MLAGEPALLLANKYRPNINLSDYYVSEKLDGIRAYWDGQQLISRSGNNFSAPTWFTDQFPSVALDGELWSQRGDFENISSIVRQSKAHSGWQSIRYMVFDLPQAKQPFDQRLKTLAQIIQQANSPYLKLVKQYIISDHASLISHMQAIVAKGGEGLMLHHKKSYYRSGRSDDLIKLKPFYDAEAKIIAHHQGQGKFSGMLGSITVTNISNAKRFKIGSGFSRLERQNPPPIGSIITYRYYGLTKKGIPRFATFLRVYNDVLP